MAAINQPDWFRTVQGVPFFGIQTPTGQIHSVAPQMNRIVPFGGYPTAGGAGGAPSPVAMPSVRFNPFSVGSPYAPVTLPKQNASGVIEIPRSTTQGAANTAARKTFGTNQAQENQTLTEFTKNYLATKPQAQSYLDQESSAIGKFYGTGPGSATYDLNQIESKNSNAINNAAQSAIRRAALANSIRRQQSGNNSSNDRWIQQVLGNIAADTAQKQNANTAANYRYVAGNQQSLAGLRQKLLNDLLMRDTAPVDLANRWQANDLSSLGTLANLENANTIYDDTALQRQQLLNSLA